MLTAQTFAFCPRQVIVKDGRFNFIGSVSAGCELTRSPLLGAKPVRAAILHFAIFGIAVLALSAASPALAAESLHGDPRNGGGGT